MDKLRIDKWLWAARFFKTRSLAKAAIEGGKIQVGGQRVKVSKEIVVGDHLTIRQGWDEKDVRVCALSDKRGSAPIAQMLYQESTESVERRLRAAEARKAAGYLARPIQKPDKYQRRQLNKLQRHLDD